MGFINFKGEDFSRTFFTESEMIERYVGNQLWGCGDNPSGELGDNSIIDRSIFVQTNIGGMNWSNVSCGGSHTLALKTDGTLWAWGLNAFGELGDNTIVQKTSPIQIGTDKWKQISAGYTHSAGIKTDGSLWVWGYNQLGAIGDNSQIDKWIPTQTSASGNDWKQVSCGTYNTFAIKTDGTLWVWGNNTNGKLGNGNATDQLVPVQTSASGTDWKSVKAGATFTAAIKTDGSLWTWGENLNGQLGRGNIIGQSSIPVHIGTDTDWKSLACGFYHTIAVKHNGTLWAWGYNAYGQLGDNTVVLKNAPFQLGTDNNWKSTSCGDLHSAAIKTDGSLWTWGYNFYGQLGDNTEVDKHIPIQTTKGGNNWKQVSTGDFNTMGILFKD